MNSELGKGRGQNEHWLSLVQGRARTEKIGKLSSVRDRQSGVYKKKLGGGGGERKEKWRRFEANKVLPGLMEDQGGCDEKRLGGPFVKGGGKNKEGISVMHCAANGVLF